MANSEIKEEKQQEVISIENPIDMELTLSKIKEAQDYRETIRAKANE